MSESPEGFRWKPIALSIIVEATKLAEARELQSTLLKLNPENSVKRTTWQRMEDNINSIIAELVIGRKLVDRKWVPHCNKFHTVADVGEDIEVRSTVYPTGGLILRDNDDPSRRYALVIVDAMKGYKEIGWIYGHEGMTEEWKVKTQATERPYWRYHGKYNAPITLTLDRPKDAQNSHEFAW